MEWLLFSNLKKQAINLHKKHGWMKETRPERMYIVSFSSYVILGKKKKKNPRGRNANHCNGFEGDNIQPGKLKGFLKW